MTAVEDEFDQAEEAVTPQRWSWSRLAGIGMATVGTMFGAVSLACQETAEAVASHIAYKEDRRGFVESVTSDIDKISLGNY